jgi:thymidylate synthase
VKFAVAHLALAGALCAPPNAAMANTGEDLYASCGGASKAACYAYLQGIVDDSKLVDGDLGPRFVGEIGRFCLRPSVTMDQVYDAVMRQLRANPSSRKYTAALQVRFALVRAFPCPPLPPRRSSP